MRTVYLDSDYRVHLTQTGNLMPYITNVFDGKCDTYVEGYRIVPEGAVWTRDDGIEFVGPMVAAAASFGETFSVQKQYEEDCSNMMTLEEAAELIDIVYESDLEIIG